jgi:hypothetical protein
MEKSSENNINNYLIHAPLKQKSKNNKGAIIE